VDQYHGEEVKMDVFWSHHVTGLDVTVLWNDTMLER